MSIVLRHLHIDGRLRGDVAIGPDREMFDNCELKNLTFVVECGHGLVAIATHFDNVKLLIDPKEPIHEKFVRCLFTGGNAKQLDSHFFNECHFLEPLAPPSTTASSKEKA